jgi:GAF domain-containing protein
MTGQAADGSHPASVERLQLAALRRVAMLVASPAGPAEVFSEVAGEIRELLGADVATIMRFEPDGTATALARVGTTSQPELVTGRTGPGGPPHRPARPRR